MTEEQELRLQSLQLAIPSSANGERKEEVVSRAEAYYNYLRGAENQKGNQNG